MKIVRGYSQFLNSLNDELRRGVIADTNVLIAATYDLDLAHEEATGLFDLMAENAIPVFCNVNVRSEFLEIHRRIIFTEALLDFETQVNKASVPEDLRKRLNSIRSQAEKRLREEKLPLRLSDADIKDFKLKMSRIVGRSRDLWTALCEDRVGDKLSGVWTETETELGLNFLSLRKEDQERYFEKAPQWEDATRLMEVHGLSSSDAMIINLFLCSTLTAIVTSDLDVAYSLQKVGNEAKLVFLPDKLAKDFV